MKLLTRIDSVNTCELVVVRFTELLVALVLTRLK